MSLYTPAHFSSRDAQDALRLVADYPFATLVTIGGGPDPCITHLPLIWEPGDSPHGTLLGHMARANPHWERFFTGETLALFHGPHAYISPSWYVNPDREVPTWNYAVVHAYGRPALIEGRDDKLALIDRSVATFERGYRPPWTRKVEGPRLEAMLNAIVGFRIPVERMEAKFKMNQNRTPGDRAQVAERLDAAGHPDLAAMAQWIRSHESG